MSSTAIAAAALPEQIPAPADPVAVPATELVRPAGEGDTCVEVADKKLTLLPREQIGFVFQFLSLESPDPSEPELDDEAARVKRNRERLDVDDLPRAPVEPEVSLPRTDTRETDGDQTRAGRDGGL